MAFIKYIGNVHFNRDYKRRKTETSLKNIAGVRIRFSFKNV